MNTRPATAPAAPACPWGEQCASPFCPEHRARLEARPAQDPRTDQVLLFMRGAQVLRVDEAGGLYLDGKAAADPSTIAHARALLSALGSLAAEAYHDPQLHMGTMLQAVRDAEAEALEHKRRAAEHDDARAAAEAEASSLEIARDEHAKRADAAEALAATLRAELEKLAPAPETPPTPPVTP